MLAPATIPTPEMVGLLLWWGVVLAAPIVVLRRRGQRRAASQPSRRVVGRRWRETRRRAAVPISEPRTPPQPACRPPHEPIERWSNTWAPAGGADRSRAGTSWATCTRAAEDGAAPVPMLARLSPGTLEPLCRYVDFRRRLELAAGELVVRLRELPADRWRIEPYPLTGERRNSLLVMGERGIFVISATYAPGHWDDVIAVSRLAAKIQWLLPGYPGQVQAAICHPFSTVLPRAWHRPDDSGEWVAAWLVGGDSVIEWLTGFRATPGLSVADLASFDRLSTPDWRRPAIPTPATWPTIHGARDARG